MNRIRICMERLDNIDVVAEKIQGRLWFHYDHETYVYEPESRATAKRESHLGKRWKNYFGADAGENSARRRQNRRQRKFGQVVVVMEAMKMEYTLASSIDGNGRGRFRCKVGQQVKLGQTLVRLKEDRIEMANFDLYRRSRRA